jgi:amino acid transporter
VSRRTHGSPGPKGSFALGAVLNSRAVLLIAFAFAVMGDPVSSVAYAIEAKLRALGGDLTLLIPTLSLALAVVGVIVVNYQQVVERFPQGGGAAAAAGSAFGETWAFIPLGALIVDFALTISISASAAASAIIAYAPSLAGSRMWLAIFVLLLVAGVTWFGHLGRAVFAVMTLSFVIVAVVVIVRGFFLAAPVGGMHPVDHGHGATVAVLLGFPVAMALATGIEAPSSAIAQLGMLDDQGRRRFGRITLWLTLGVVVVLTLGLGALGVRLHVGVPGQNSTFVADVARRTGEVLFAAFQLTAGLVLLAAASSSFQAGPGLLKALAGDPRSGVTTSILPEWVGRTNRHHTPYWGVVVFLVASAAVVVGAGGHEQTLAIVYAVSVFVSFLAGILALARFSRRERRWGRFVVNVVGVLVVVLTLLVNFGRGSPIVALAASFVVSGVLYLLWVRAGRPRGVSESEAAGELIIGEEVEPS